MKQEIRSEEPSIEEKERDRSDAYVADQIPRGIAQSRPGGQDSRGKSLSE